VAVLIFFSICGFLIASWWAMVPCPWRFAFRWFLRIWPAYAAVVVLMALWFLMTDPRAIAGFAAWIYVIKNLTLQHFEWQFFPSRPDPRMNPPLWTIPFEVLCYAGFAMTAFVLRRHWKAIAPIFLVPAFLAAVGMRAFDPSAATLTTDLAFFGAVFLHGALLHAWPVLRSWKGLLPTLFAGVAAFVAGSQVIALVLVVPALSVWVGRQSWLALRDASRFGDLSYGAYLWGWPVQCALAGWLGKSVDPPILALLSFALVLVCAFVSWHLLEKQALKLKPAVGAPWPKRFTLELS
jgi:peptidoglycan/LPS O-acetylase OafA/YrhL